MVIITVNLVYVDGSQKKIKVDTNDTILDLKKKYGYSLERVRLGCNGRNLMDDRKIKDYNIKQGSIIYVLERLIGGEVGSTAKGFTDPTKVGPIRYATTTEGPDYLTVEKGINFFGNCINKNCIAHNKEVCSPFGFGTFDLMKDLDSKNEKCPKCPACEIPLLKLETCGFMMCKFKYNGQKIENGKIVPVNYENSISVPHKLDYFSAGKNGENKSVWIDLKISAYSL